MKKIKSKDSLIPRHTLDDLASRVKDVDLNAYFIFGAIILVLIVGLYAIFAPGAQNQSVGNPACGKIVIATTGTSLRSTVAQTLEGAPFFLIVDPLSGKLIESIRNPYRGTQPDPQIAYLIAGKGEEAVIVGNIDAQSYNILMQFGIRVFGGYTGQTKRVIRLYRQARITQSPSPDTVSQVSTPQASLNNGTQGAAWGGPDINGMGPVYQNYGYPMMQGMNAGMGWRNMNAMNAMNAPCPLPGRGAWMQGAMPQALPDADTMRQTNATTQVAFGWGQQAFVCPNCNWRMKAARQGNSFPTCPNCGSSMALDVQNTNNNGWIQQWGDQIANMDQLQPQYNQMMNQPNFWQGKESTGFFLCPNCNWRMFAQQGQNSFPRCPNCGQIMARGGAYNLNQNNQPNYYNYGNNPMAPVAAPMPIQAPPIPSNAQMTHEYRGVCSNCHQIIDSATGGNNVPPAAQQMQGNYTPQPQGQNSVRVGIGKRANK